MKTFSDWIDEQGGCKEASTWVRDVAKNDVAKAIRQCPNAWWLQWLRERIELTRYGCWEDMQNEYNENMVGFILGAERALEKFIPRPVKANATLTRAAAKERRAQIRRTVSQMVQKEYFEYVSNTVNELASICDVAPTAKKART